jgi:hypothetical protein
MPAFNFDLTFVTITILFILLALLLASLILQHFRQVKHMEKHPPISLDALTVIVQEAVSHATSSILNSNSNLFTQKIEKSYEENLRGALSTVQKDEERLNEEAQREFGHLGEEFNQHLSQLEQSARVQIESTIQKMAAAESSYEAFLQNLNTTSQKTQIASIEGAKQKVDKLFEDFEVKLADFLLQSEQKMMLAVDLELRSARQLIDTYKVQQMNVIDENIMAMLEKTLSLVLAKNLDLKDQMDLVYESLEKAKAEKFVV